METLGAKEGRRTDCRFRSGIGKLAAMAAMLVLSVGAVVNAAASVVSREYAGALKRQDALSLRALGIDTGSGRPHLNPGQAGHPISSNNSTSSMDLPRTTTGVLEADMTESGQKCGKNPISARPVDPTDYEYGCSAIEEMLSGNFTRVGQGGVRTVFLVEYEGRKLAVKTLNDKKRLAKHVREVATLNALRGHPHVVGMLGVCNTTVVTDFIAESFSDIVSRDGEDFPTRRLISLSIGAAKGLQALHEIAGGIHMDLKPSQLLVSETGRGMLNDFNSVHIMSVSPADQQAFCPSRIKPGSQRNLWRPPEDLAGQPLTPKADIYSLGMILYSAVAAQKPYDSSVESLKVARKTGARPEIDARWHTGFMEVVEDMWSERPEDRPSARQVVGRLQALLAELDTQENSSFF